jgi:hypothetical protein
LIAGRFAPGSAAQPNVEEFRKTLDHQLAENLRQA